MSVGSTSSSSDRSSSSSSSSSSTRSNSSESTSSQNESGKSSTSADKASSKNTASSSPQTTPTQERFARSSFESPSGVTPTTQNPAQQTAQARTQQAQARTTPDLQVDLFSPTPVAQQAAFKAPELNPQAVSPTPLGPPSRFEARPNPALSPTPMAQQAVLRAPEFSSRMLSPEPLGPVAAKFEPVERGLPQPVELNLTSPVGANGTNLPADVRQVQDRLNDLGFLSDEDFAAEKADPTQTEALPEENLGKTIEAIRDFQEVVVGVDDGNISPTGITAFSLKDPTYGTQTTFNSRAADPTAGVPLDSFELPPPVERIIGAIETVEAGSARLGEIPARLSNAAGTPASFGSGQLIGGTAVEVLKDHPRVAEHYGLDTAELAELGTIARDTTTRYNDILDRVPAGGLTEAELQTRIAEYTEREGAAFRQETGLQNSDIENMFRAAQLRQQLRAADSIDSAMENTDVATNVEALGMRLSSVEHYFDNPGHFGENRQGFVTRALFTSEHGQALRDAMTDNGGIAMSRALIGDNYAAVLREGREQLGRPLTAAEAAEATMLVHNRGMGALDDLLESFGNPNRTINPYVANAMQHWTPE